MHTLILVAAGGALGALARYGVVLTVHRVLPATFPWGTFVVNCSGAFAIGLVFHLVDRSLVPSDVRSLVMIGFIGAYTTFSSFGLETIQLLRDGETVLAMVNVLATNILGIAFIAAGILSARFLVTWIS